jgi:hypothetical protein
MIDTRHVQDRRSLRFESFDEVMADAQALAEAERRGTLRATGNWSLGQALGHLAFWANAPFDGYPDMPPMPWLMRRLLPLFKNRFFNKGMPVGVRIRGVPAGTFGTDPMETDQSLPAYRAALDRMAKQQPTTPNPIFDHMTHDEWIKLNLRHAELHLGFFHSE